jgi:hypothetical protein
LRIIWLEDLVFKILLVENYPAGGFSFQNIIGWIGRLEDLVFKILLVGNYLAGGFSFQNIIG